ncbi:MAG: hypothetical protein DHS20C11_32980 [Lysobacteraceae bacterium]|nr:MAG: hypothetical protein DHS20C11_32980 [Xanthomonadaceae bacterium]
MKRFTAAIGLFAMSLTSATGALAQDKTMDRQTNEVSPVRGIERDSAARPPRPRPDPDSEVQSIDGWGNNETTLDMGSAHSSLTRMTGANYADGINTIDDANLPSPRAISNAVHQEDRARPNRQRYTDMLWQWGQFLDHDISITDGANPPEPAPISVPTGDPSFDPGSSGTAQIDFNRSIYDPDSTPRQQINEITAWIDGSNVYGSDQARADALRTFVDGQLKTSDGELLPFNDLGLANAGGPSPTLFLAGDVRANEQVGLAAMHTLFVREHNRIARLRKIRRAEATDEELYQYARRMVIAQLQVITYRDFVPALLGSDGLPRYRGYDPSVDAGIRNEFSTAAYRLGHTLLSPILLRLDADGNEYAAGHLSLADAFFAPSELVDHGIEPLLRGLSSQVCQELDVYVVDEVRDFLFGPPGAGGFDLASLNIQRGRDHGLARYNDVREAMGFERAATFADISRDRRVRQRLASVYASPDDVDLWTGGLAEERADGAMLGPLFASIVATQFAALRDGDRFWYQRTLSPQDQRRVERTTLAEIIRRNTSIGDELADNVFRLPPPAG